MKTKPAGNILITAIFMSVFLFFLSVALISQNRMDLSLGLSVDHRLKADAAASAGLSWALYTMRTQPEWESILRQGAPSLESGASFSIEVRAPSKSNTSSHLLIVTSVGTSSLISSSHWAIVEEVKKTPKDQKGPVQLFSYAKATSAKSKDHLAMMGSDFKWYDLGELPSPATTLAAAGGPLFTFAPEGSAEIPPSIVDCIPLFLESGEETIGPPVRLELAPPGQHLITLTIKNDKFDWLDIPDPGPKLGSWAGLTEVNDEVMKSLPVVKLWDEQPKSNDSPQPVPWENRIVSLKGRGDRDSGFDIFSIDIRTGVWSESEHATVYFYKGEPWPSVQSVSLEDLSLDWDKITNAPPVYLDWYSITGSALVARENKIFCLGEHFFYGHIPVPNKTFPDFGTPLYESIVYRKPCILEYDLVNERWSVSADLLKVTSKDQKPEVTRCPPWGKDTLAVDNKERGLVATIPSEGAKKHLLSFDTKSRSSSYKDLGEFPSPLARVITYKDQAYFVTEREYWDEETTSLRTALKNVENSSRWLDPNDSLKAVIPAATGIIIKDKKEEIVQFKSEEVITYGLKGGANNIVSWGEDLIALGYVKRRCSDISDSQVGYYNHKASNAAVFNTMTLTFFRYDGSTWQAFPNGANDLLKNSPQTDPLGAPANPESSSCYLDTKYLNTSSIALASYDDKKPDLKRYGVIAAGRGLPPKLEGFEDK